MSECPAPPLLDFVKVLCPYLRENQLSVETQMALTLYFMSGKFQMLSEFLGHQFSLS